MPKVKDGFLVVLRAKEMAEEGIITTEEHLAGLRDMSRDELPTALSGIPEALLRSISCHTPDLVTPHGLFPFAALSCMYLIAFIVVSFSLSSASASAVLSPIRLRIRSHHLLSASASDILLRA